MRSFKSRIEALENEYLFSEWLRFQRLLESLTDEQLNEFATYGYLLGPSPEPLPQGASRLDCLDRNALMKLFREDEVKRTQFHLRSHEDQEFYCHHVHWPEQACAQDCIGLQRQGGSAQ